MNYFELSEDSVAPVNIRKAHDAIQDHVRCDFQEIQLGEVLGFEVSQTSHAEH